MRGWTTRAVLTALLLSSCGKVTRNAATGFGGNSGNSGGGGGGEGPCVPIDVDGDGRSDGCDRNGDGIIDGGPESTDGIILDGDITTDGYIEGPGPCSIPATTQLPRLTNAQYDNTIRDLTGLDTRPSTMLAPDSLGSMDARTWTGYWDAAISIAEQVMADDALRDDLVPCSSADEACANQFITEFGSRAYRRPLTAEEISRYQNFYTRRDELTEHGTFDEAVQLMLEVFLMSPSFLMRTELAAIPVGYGPYFALSGFELATRLSYMLWNSMPDEDLFAAATEGRLDTPESIRQEAQRMLQDPRARGPVAEFHREYMQMGPGSRWAAIAPDPDRFPNFDPALVPLMVEETERVFDHVVFEQGGSFADLLTTPVGFLNAELAPLYGVDPDGFGSSLSLVEYDPEVRPGVFTRAGFLAAHAWPERTSPIRRGAFLESKVLCTETGSHPDGVQTYPLVNSASLVTNRDKVDAQTADPACAGCHYPFINPPGYALEGFDTVGAVQTTDNDQGVPVDTTASVYVGGVTVDVGNARDLMAAIATSPQAMTCYAQKLVAHAYERPANVDDRCVVEQLAAELAQGEPVLNLVADLTQTDSFRYRQPE